MNRFPHVCWSPTSSCHFLPNRLGPSDPPIRFQGADPETAAQQARTRILHIGPYRFMLSQSCSHFGPNKRPVISPRLPRPVTMAPKKGTKRTAAVANVEEISEAKKIKEPHPESFSNPAVILLYIGCLPQL